MRLFLSIILLLLITSGCSTLLKSKPTLADSLSSKAVHIEVAKILQQSEESCGLASVDMLTSHYGVTLNDSLRNQMLEEVAAKNSISGSTLKQVLEKAGYRVAVFPGTLDEEPTGLYRHLKRNRPLIVLLSSSENQVGHYCLVTGFDPKNEWIVLVDPTKGEYIMVAFPC